MKDIISGRAYPKKSVKSCRRKLIGQQAMVVLMTLALIFNASCICIPSAKTPVSTEPAKLLPATQPSYVTEAGYDKLGRLIAVKFEDGATETYAYDAVGNRLSKTNSKTGLVTYKYNEADELVSGSNDTAYTYDGNGNLSSKTAQGKVTRFSWDASDRLIRIDYPDGTLSSYAYDPLGRRVSKAGRDGRTVRYIYDGDNIVQEIDASGQLLASYVHERVPDHPVSMSRGGKTYYYLYDRLGSVIGLADENGKMVVWYDYDAWGNILAESTGGIENPFRFTGREWDTESGLYYYRARYYDPAAGRFISRDPLPGSATDPQSLNRYAYVRNSPLNYGDPYGLQERRGLWKSWLDFYSLPIVVQEQLQREKVDNFMKLWADMSKEALQKATLSSWIWRGLEATGYNVLSGFVLGGQAQTQNQMNAQYIRGLSLSLLGLKSPVGATFGGTITCLEADSLMKQGKLQEGTQTLYIWTAKTAIPFLGGPSWSGGEDPLKDIIAAGGSTVSLASGLLGTFQDQSHSRPGRTASSAAVGGVRLDKAAQVFADLTDIQGATYDPVTGQLVLWGKKDLSLPKMDLDDLVVAIRSVYAGEDPGVSIDPADPRNLENGKMRVSYYGQTRNTHFGQVMFEADRYLKNLSAGKDNETGAAITSKVPGFKNELQLFVDRAGDSGSEPQWHRLWFVPDEMTLKLAQDQRSLIFDSASINVQARFVRFLPDGTKQDIPGLTDPAVNTFVQHFNTHYDEFGAEKPEVKELVQLGKIVAIAKFIKDKNIPLDMGWIDQYQVKYVQTPETTSGITVTASKGNVVFSLYGGVDFSKENDYLPGTDPQGSAINAARTSDTAVAWEAEARGQKYAAVALSLAKIPRSGSFFQSRTDLQVPGRGGLSMYLGRYYNSFDDSPSELGHGWRLSLPQILVPKDSPPTLLVDGKKVQLYQTLTMRGAQGNETEYVLGQDSSKRLQYFVKEHPDVVIEPGSDGTYALVSPDKSQATFDAKGKLLLIIDASGNRLSYTYNQGNLVKITDAAGRELTLAYDNRDRITQVTGPGQTRVSYVYDSDGNLGAVDTQGGRTAYTYKEHRLVSAVNPAGEALFTNSYDEIGRMVAQQVAGGDAYGANHDWRNRQETVTARSGKKAITTYDDKGRLLTETDFLGNKAAYNYDEKTGKIASIGDKLGNATRFEYAAGGDLRSTVLPDGGKMTFQHDERGNLVWFIDVDGLLTEYGYDDNNRLVKVKQGAKVVKMTQEPTGLSISTQGKSSDTASFKYDKYGSLVESKDAAGQAYGFTYDNYGNLTSVKDPRGAQVQYKYDTQGRLTDLTDAGGSNVRLQYDERGNIASLSTPMGAAHYEYDAVGRPVRIIDPVGNTTSYRYDAGVLLAGVTDAMGNTTTYSYDLRGNLTSTTDANRHITRFEYDELGNLVKESDALGHTITFRYDANGQPVARTDSRGTTTFSYDKLGRPTATAYPDGRKVSYAYDAAGRSTEFVEGKLRLSYRYDERGRPIEVADWNDQNARLRYFWDDLGNLEKVVYPDSKQVQYKYDEIGRVVEIKDWAGASTTYKYSSRSEQLSSTLGNAIVARFIYDAGINLKRLSYEFPPGRIFLGFNYEVDSIGNLLRSSTVQ